VNKEESLIR